MRVRTDRPAAFATLSRHARQRCDATQDFVLVNGPAFAAPIPAKFLVNLKMLAETTDKAEGAKKVLSAVARGTETVIEPFGGKSAMVTTMGGQTATNILGESLYSQTPFLYGDYVAKFSIASVFNLSKLTGAAIDTSGSPCLAGGGCRAFRGAWRRVGLPRPALHGS